jgi:hypothetical protein
VLGAFPEDGEATLKPSWLRFVGVGDARRSFVEFGDQIWAFIHRGAYAAFVVAEASVRPGILLDQLEQALLVAEEARQKKDTLRMPEAAGAPSGKPRTSLHPPGDRPPADVTAGAPPDAAVVSGGVPPAPGPFARPPVSAGGASEDAPTAEEPAAADASGPAAPFRASPFAEFADGVVEEPQDAPTEPEAGAPDPAAEGPVTSFPKTPQKLAGDGKAAGEQPGEIDRVMLAKEFSGLLQMDADDDEESS